MPTNNSTWRYFLGVAISIIMLGVSGWVGHLQGRVNGLAEIQASRGERISTLEAQYGAINSRLARIELLLDRLWDQRPERR